MTALFELFSRDLQGIARIDDYTRGTLAAEAKLEALGTAEALVPGTRSDQIDDRFRYKITVDPVDSVRLAGQQEKAIGLYRVLVTVSWDQGVNERSVSIESLKLNSIQ